MPPQLEANYAYARQFTLITQEHFATFLQIVVQKSWNSILRHSLKHLKFSGLVCTALAAMYKTGEILGFTNKSTKHAALR